MSKHTSLADIPEDVFYCSLFPLLEADKILELRLLSRWMRMYAERYLHNNLRCRRSLRIKLGEDTADDGDDSNVERATPANYSTLESFLQEDRASRIRMPVKDFSLSFRNSDVFERDPNLPEFLEKYGRQIEYLGVPYITIPPRKCEVDFYEKLPRLRWLDIMSFREEDFGPESVASFPITFRSLETLRLPNCNPDEDYADENYKLKLLECCKELKYFYLLCFTQDVVEFKKLCGILKKKTNLHFVLNYCIENPCPWNPELTPELCSLARDGGVKLCEFPTRVLVTFNDHQLEQISRQIFSLKQYWLCLPLLENFCRIRVVFPNLHEIDIFIPPEDHFVNQDDQDIQDGTLDIENILWKRICPEMFPSVKRFIIDLAECPRLSRAPSLLWQFFPNLEELRFKKNVADIVFVGERGQFPFLRLTKLRKLDLGNVSGGKLSDAAFILVFRNMRIREFRMRSSSKLTTITKSGIRALLTGPFYEAIEKFPFEGWTLADASKDELGELSLKFARKRKELLEQVRYHCNLALYQSFSWYKYFLQRISYH